jgi:uncharacterized protein (DUF362 family)/Pyruvate/2-oxoacid:ferredoxin oxidoreductase delta subunit
MSKVIVKEAAYHYETLKPLVFEIMEALGGEKIKEHQRVLIKPNLLTTAKPADAVLTHCLVVKAVVEYVLSKRAIPQVSDSPALGDFQKILQESGLKEVLQGMPVICKEFREPHSVDIGSPFGAVDLARDAVEAELIINLPKLKTHGQMLLTLGVKNMFGCVVGLKKAQWHLRMGANRAMFARLLVQICRRLQPAFTIIDGILAMEGEGPGKRGKPRQLGVLIAGNDALAVDAAVCRIIGLEPDRLPTLKAAREMSLITEAVELEGILPIISDFQLPSLSPLIYGPELLHGFIRKHLLQRPICDGKLCQMCGKCREFCPAAAIGHAPTGSADGAIVFDYERCIRCYCCIEVCPAGALHAREPFAGRLVRRIIRK